MSDRLVINIGDDENSILNELKELKKTPPSRSDDELISNKIKVSTNNKKKKKRKKNEITDGIYIDPEDTIDDTFIEIDDDMYFDNRSITDIYEEEKANERKKKKGKKKDSYSKEFEKELKSLYELLNETKEFNTTLDNSYKGLYKNRSVGSSKFSVDLASVINSTRQTRLNIIKEIGGIRKTIADLNMKKENKDPSSDSLSHDKLASSFFNNILNEGRGAFIESTTGNFDEAEIKYTDDDTSLFDDNTYNMLKERVLNESNRSDAADKYIEYENRNVEVYVKKYEDTGEWEFVAIDKDGIIIDDYPTPSKAMVGKMKFSDDGTYCTDSKGFVYRVDLHMSNE
jgi:hypothetical protein